MVTVELAIGFLTLAVMLALVVCVVAAGVARSSVCQAVREAAREASVGGEDPASAASQAFGAPVDIRVARSDRWVTVTGSVPVAGPVGWAGTTARCQATTLLEQAVP